MAASPDGRLVAVAFSFIAPPNCGGTGQPSCPRGGPSDYIVVVNTATGAKSVFRGGLKALGPHFSVGNLSWADGGRELVFLGQWCHVDMSMGSESCGTGKAGGDRVAGVRTLNPASGGGRLGSGRLLFGQSARYPYIAQAVISPHGSTLTTLVLRGPGVGTRQISGGVPDNMTVEQISVATGRRLGVLYRRHLGPTSEVNGVPDFLALIPDGTGQHWIINGGICVGNCSSGFNDWIDHRRLVPLRPADGRLAAEAW